MARVTAAEVAKRAGVSVATVSLVVNGKDEGRVLPETRDRVLGVVADLGYRPDLRGRGLSTGRSQTIAFLAPDIANPFYGRVQVGILRELDRAFRLVTVTPPPGEPLTVDYVQNAIDLGVDGLIIVSSAWPNEKNDVSLPPSVFLDGPKTPGPWSHVDLDVESSGRALARHLRDLGHSAVLYLEANTNSPTLRRRQAAFTKEFKRGRAGGSVAVDYSAVDTDLTRSWMHGNPNVWAGVTAIVCATDLQAYGVILSLKELGIEVPSQVSVAGGEDLPTSRLIEPSLTTAHYPAEELGAIGLSHLLSLLKGETGHVELELPTEFVARASTAAARTS